MRNTLVVGLALAWATPAPAGDAMPWAADYESARLQAAASGKLIMLDFYADW